MDLVSVVVPVYNSEKTLERCLNSIVNQSYKNIEVIIIDDGSTDNSKNIYDSFNDIRLQRIYKQNGGVSSTRNLGIEKARGKYICFVDSDDYLHKDYIKLMYEAINSNNSELVICNFYNDSSIGLVKNYSVREENIIKHQNQIYEIYSKCLLNQPWNKMYVKAKINKYFDLNLSLGEDLIFNIDYLNNITLITTLNKYLYYYDIKNTGLHSINQNINEFFYLYEYIYTEYLKKHNLDLKKFNGFLIKHYVRYLYENKMKINYTNFKQLQTFLRNYNVKSSYLIFFALGHGYSILKKK